MRLNNSGANIELQTPNPGRFLRTSHPQSRFPTMDGQEAAPPVVNAAANGTNGTFPAADAAGQTVAAIAQAETISAGKTVFRRLSGPANSETDEIALYDRQIRLWGVQAQEK